MAKLTRLDACWRHEMMAVGLDFIINKEPSSLHVNGAPLVLSSAGWASAYYIVLKSRQHTEFSLLPPVRQDRVLAPCHLQNPHKGGQIKSNALLRLFEDLQRTYLYKKGIYLTELGTACGVGRHAFKRCI
jgi:hypothetical protein